MFVIDLEKDYLSIVAHEVGIFSQSDHLVFPRFSQVDPKPLQILDPIYNHFHENKEILARRSFIVITFHSQSLTTTTTGSLVITLRLSRPTNLTSL